MNERAYQSMISVEKDLIPLLPNRVRCQEYLDAFKIEYLDNTVFSLFK